MTRIKQLGHVVLLVHDPMKSADWYRDLLGTETVVRNDHIPAAFFFIRYPRSRSCTVSSSG